MASWHIRPPNHERAPVQEGLFVGPLSSGANGASHIHEMHIQILRHKPGTPEHTIRARLSEAVSDGLLDRLGDGFYDVYAEDEGMMPVWSLRGMGVCGPRG